MQIKNIVYALSMHAVAIGLLCGGYMLLEHPKKAVASIQIEIADEHKLTDAELRQVISMIGDLHNGVAVIQQQTNANAAAARGGDHE